VLAGFSPTHPSLIRGTPASIPTNSTAVAAWNSPFLASEAFLSSLAIGCLPIVPLVFCY
jgi:hypothetical protein